MTSEVPARLCPGALLPAREQDNRDTEARPAQRCNQLPGAFADYRLLPGPAALRGDARRPDAHRVLLRDCEAEWSGPGGLYRRISTSAPPIDAALVVFERFDECRPVLCLLLSGGTLAMQTAGGEVLKTPVGAAYTQLHALPRGVLLSSACSGRSSESDAPTAALLHPLEGPTRVLARGGVDSPRQALPATEVPCFSDPRAPFVLTWSTTSSRLSVWRVRFDDAEAPNPAAVGATPAPVAGVPATPAHTTTAPRSTAGPSLARTPRAPGSKTQPRLTRTPSKTHATTVADVAERHELEAALRPPEPAPSLHLVWQGAPGRSAAQAFLSTGIDSTPLMCLVSREASELLAVRLPRAEGERAAVEFTIPHCASAQPVRAARAALRASYGPAAPARARPPWSRWWKHLPQTDILALSPSGELAVYAGAQRLAHVAAPIEHSGLAAPATPHARTPRRVSSDMEQDSDGNEPVDAFPTPASHPIDIDASGSFDSSGMSGIQPLPAAPGPVDLRGAVLAEGLGTKAVVVLGNGARSVRVHVGIDAPTSLPAQQVLEALASALGAEAFVPGHAAAICAVQHAATRCSGPQDLHAAEWGATASAILTWLGVSGQNLRRSQETDRGGSGRTPFERLVADSARRRGTDATGRAVAALLSNIGLDAQLAGSTRVAAGGRGDARLAAAASTLHALYEAWRIEPLCWRHLPALADLLGSLCAALGWRAHAERYCRDGMAVAVPDRDAKGEPAVADLLEGCRLLAAGRVEAARGVLPPQLAGEGRLSAGDIRKVPTCMRLAVRVVAAYHVLAAQARVAAELRVRRAREGRAASADGADGADAVVLLRRMTEVGWTPGELDRVAAGVALPLRQALWDLKQRPPEGLTPAAYLIIGRDDVAAMAARSTASDGDTVALAWVRSLQAFARPQTERLPVQDADDADDEAVVSADGTPGAAPLQGHARLPPWSHSVVTGVGALRFPRDRRVAEVVALLDSSATRDVFPPSNDADAVQTLLYRTAARTLGLPAGRGAIALHTVRVLPSTVLAAPRLVINVRLPHQNNAIVGPDERTVLANTSRPNVAALLRWAFFSNGVAEGLRASPGGAAGSRSWVALQRVTLTKDAPTEVVLTQAGTLLGLGLSGNLASLSSTDVYTLLSLDQQPTTMATLLGTAASRRGSMDTSFSRMLFLHIPSRHPASYPEIDVVPLTQSAAVLGVGLLFQGSCHRLMSEVLLEEIHPPPWDTPAPPSGAPSGSREGYARSAGLGLGLVLLCSGGRAPGLADLNIESRLRALMTGGVDPSTGAHAATIRKVGQPAKTRRAEDDVCDAARSNMRRVKASSTTLEGDLPALDITCPGATMALALMYHRTNDMRAASWFDPPASAAGLDLVRPDMLQLRTTAWCLVAWDSVGNTPDFIQSRLPPTLKGRLADLLSPPEPGDDIDGLERKLARDGEDLASKTAGHLSMITGLGLGVGLRYAGSGDAQAARTIRGEIEHILDCMRLIHGVTGHALKAGISRYAAEGALATLASALGMIMAGTGDLECVKLLRAMSLRNAKEMTSDHHATLSLALGMLFLGGGSMTLEQSPAATAALAIAFFPDFSSALGSIQRHLYAMAAVPRSVTAIDVDTRLPVQVPISITATSEAASGHDASMAADDQHAALDTHATAPWLLQERSRIQALRTMGPRYLPLVLGDGASIDALFRQRVLLVKRQAGSLPYARDESGMRSLALTARLPRTASPANGHGTVADASLEEACCLFGSDPCLSALARDCTRGFAGAMRGVEPGLFEAMLRRALLEGTEESLTLCLALLSDVTSACDAARRAGDSYLPALVGHVIGVALTHAGMAEVADARHCGPLVPPEVLRHLWDALLAATLEGGAGSALRRWLAGDASGGAAPGAAVTGWMALAGLRSWDGLECALRQADAVGSVAVAAWAVGSGGSVGGGWKLLSALEELRKDPGF